MATLFGNKCSLQWFGQIEKVEALEMFFAGKFLQM
jgi:hypothetical protein